jgi:hypothetical protein
MSYPGFAELTARRADQVKTEAVVLLKTAQQTGTAVPEPRIVQLFARAHHLEELAWQLRLEGTSTA